MWRGKLSVIIACSLVATLCHAQNVIPDPSFENGTASWTLSDYASSIDSSVARTGSKSLRLKNDASKTSHNVWQLSSGAVQAGREYEYSVWVRGSNVTGHGAGGKPLAVVRWRDSSNKRIVREMYMWAPYGSYDWRMMKIHLQAPSNAAKVDIGFRSWWDCLTGTTHWDDASLVVRDLSHRGSLAGTYQAEDAGAKQGGKVESVEPNYTGSGYFRPQSSGAHVEWHNVSGGGTGGVRILAFRYAWEGNEKRFEVFVNGKSLGSVKPLATGQINSWASFEQQATLKAAYNTIRITVPQVTAGPLIDKLTVYHKAGTPPPKDAGVQPDQSTPAKDAGVEHDQFVPPIEDARVQPDQSTPAKDAGVEHDASITPIEDAQAPPDDTGGPLDRGLDTHDTSADNDCCSPPGQQSSAGRLYGGAGCAVADDRPTTSLLWLWALVMVLAVSMRRTSLGRGWRQFGG